VGGLHMTLRGHATINNQPPRRSIGIRMGSALQNLHDVMGEGRPPRAAPRGAAPREGPRSARRHVTRLVLVVDAIDGIDIVVSGRGGRSCFDPATPAQRHSKREELLRKRDLVLVRMRARGEEGLRARPLPSPSVTPRRVCLFLHAVHVRLLELGIVVME